MHRRVDGRRGAHTKVQGISIPNRTSSTVTRRTTKKTPSTTSSSSTKNLPTFALIPFDTRAEESDNSEGESTKSSAKRGEGSTKRFACPFFKNDPIKYGTQDRRRCAGTGWPDISRLKFAFLDSWLRASSNKIQGAFDQIPYIEDLLPQMLRGVP